MFLPELDIIEFLPEMATSNHQYNYAKREIFGRSLFFSKNMTGAELFA
jgi:hypothetical protein